MFQDYALFPHMTIADNVRFGLVNGKSRERESWVAKAMERIGLERFARAYPHTLSGGQQQRAALLRAIAPGPRILLLDEPFSDLDVNRRIQVRDATLDLIKETGTATLMVTHDPEEAMFMSDRILVMGRRPHRAVGNAVRNLFPPEQRLRRGPVRPRSTAWRRRSGAGGRKRLSAVSTPPISPTEPRSRCSSGSKD